ncbi:MAG TPA: hydrogen peroxide-dependent heme synthase [Candidatus Polarisedimenticolia bacterium]|nr:hydrogen peroxide-dependent heme synthase [Candidatus Polarisedimenticolia bacterium]
MHNPQVPETLEGWSVLHQMFRIRWDAWKLTARDRRKKLADEAAALLSPLEGRKEGPSALVQILGHKADLMLIHFRKSFDELSQIQLRVAGLGLHEHLEATSSYLSIVELGMYEMTAKIHEDLKGRGLKSGTDEFDKAFDEEMAKQRERVIGRLFSDIPRRRQVCFYPMNKRRGEVKNWYTVPFEKRAAMMREHGLIGRAYSGQVTQIISGSIGLDDWEWGVDLFADDPLVFKKLIYELRFDEASADYAEFGPFYVGLQFAARELPSLLEGRTPTL